MKPRIAFPGTFVNLPQGRKRFGRNFTLIRKIQWNTLFPDDLPVEGTGHAGKVESEILGDVGGLLLVVRIHADSH